MSDHHLQETVAYWRSTNLPGFEVRTADFSVGNVSNYNRGFQFLISTSWCGVVRFRDQLTRIEAGNMLGIGPDNLLVLGASEQAGSWCLISIDESILRSLAEDGSFTLGELMLEERLALTGPLQRMLQGLREALEPGKAGGSLESILMQFTSILSRLRPVDEGEMQVATGDKFRVEQIFRHLSSHQSGPANLREIAREAGIDRYRAVRLFKKSYGLPPCAYQLRLRLGYAQQALREGMHPAEAAANYGFADQSHFTRLFRRSFGLTPAKYAALGS